MKAFRIAMAIVFLAGPASAQAINLLTDKVPKSAEERAREKAIEDAYKDKMNKVPEQKGSSDPWATVRSTDAPKNNPPARKSNSR